MMAMKALIGIDPSDVFRPAMELFRRLRFGDMEAELLFSVESVSPKANAPQIPSDHPLALVVRQQEEEGRRYLAEAEALLGGEVRSSCHLGYGDAVHAMVARADEIGADLIVAGSARKGTFGSLFFGSVSKGLLVDARLSVLIGKHAPAVADGMTAVLATDHSDYARRSIDSLLRIRPHGLSRLVLLTALPTGTEEEAGRDVQALMADLARDLEGLSLECEARIVEAHPNEAIRQAMADEKADLLIMGAQGRGFIDRVTIGSISFHQVVNEPHNVLVLRP
jgi:nucleotide-binding universal stress UspA family protein